jgi:hypothetical protein
MAGVGAPRTGHVGCPRRRLSHKDRPPQPPKSSLCLLPPSRPHPIKAPPPTHHTARDHHPPWRPEPKKKRRASCRSRLISTLAPEMRYVYSPAICSSAAIPRRACFMLSHRDAGDCMRGRVLVRHDCVSPRHACLLDRLDCATRLRRLMVHRSCLRCLDERAQTWMRQDASSHHHACRMPYAATHNQETLF